MANLGSIGSDKWKDFIARSAEDMGISLDRTKLDLLAEHCMLLVKWNETSNLTRITDPVEVALKHVLDSMVSLPYIPMGARVLDVGSGGGFPGMVLKIIEPDLAVTLIDASRKKISFLNHVIRLTGLRKIRAIQKRAGELAGLPEYQHAFEIVVCRSFAAMDVFVRDAISFLPPDGKMIAYKKKDIGDEITRLEDMPQMKDLSLKLIPYTLPGLESERVLVILKRAALA